MINNFTKKLGRVQNSIISILYLRLPLQNHLHLKNRQKSQPPTNSLKRTMNNDPLTKKLNYQLQQMAFQKYPFQINNKNFFCLESYFEDELLNGVDLEIKEAKGMTSEPQKISYIAQSQEIILTMGSNILTYNAQKRSYSLLTEVHGFVQILRTYTSKINNRTFVFWLQSDQEGLNIRTKRNSKSNTNVNGTQTNNDEKKQPKVTSIWEIGPIAQLLLGKKPDRINQDQNKGISAKTGIKTGVFESPTKKVKFQQDTEQERAKSKKKVRIDAPANTSAQSDPKNKKKMRICIFDYEKKYMMHKQPLEINQNQTINEIFLYFMTEKMVGYIINDENEERGKVYYKKVRIDDFYGLGRSSSNRSVQRKRTKLTPKRPDQYNVLDSIFELPLLKYNGETDQYLFKDLNTVYSLQVYQAEHEMVVGKPSSKRLVQGGNSPMKSNNQNMISSHSIQLSDNESQGNEQALSKQIEKVTRSIIGSSITRISHQREKYKLKICEEIELLTEENIIDISISQVYLVVLTNQLIRFYSIFNLNTLLFKCEIHGVKDFPAPSSVELNKSYLLLTHENSTFVSSYSILERKLKYNSTCQVEIEHCQSIIKLFMNSYNCQVAILARQFEIQGRMTNILKSKKIIQASSSTYRKTYLDISLAYINFSSTKCQTKALYLKNQRFRNVLTCKWHSQYLIETENQILAKDWREGFENLKCACLHPTGQYLVIGFNDCFKMYAVTQEGLQNTYMSDGVKDCQAIAYSEYGQHFAVGSSNTINIYNSYNCKKKLTINLPMGSLVQSLEYRNNHLICILKTKRIVIYHALLEYKQTFTFNPKNYLNQNKHEFQKIKPGDSVQNLLALTIKGLVSIDVNSLFYDLDLQVVIFSSGKKIIFLNTLTNESLGTYDLEAISCMEYNKHLATLFLGTFSGELIAFPWPNKPSNILSQLPRFKFHSEKIIKIKMTSDFKYLITLGNDMSIYKSHVSYILNLKRLKGNQIAQYKGNKNTVTHCNFLQNRGICQFSHSQTIEKLQTKKQLEQQVVNTVFMLPEQRMKQKEQLFEQISVTKEQLAQENIKQYEPLQQESISLRNNIIKLKDELIQVHRVSQAAIQRQKQLYSTQTSKLLNAFSQIHHELRQVKSKLQKEIKEIKEKNQKQYEELIKEHIKKEEELKKQIQVKKIHAESLQNNFLELTLIDEEKQSFLKQQLAAYQKEFQQLTTKNGQLSCKNSTIQKQILVSKYRIQELKFVIINANYSIQKLKDKKTKQTEEKLVFQTLLVENAKIDVSQMQKKYIKATKELIEKNKLIDINLSRYEKQKQILVTLEKTVQTTESQIDRIVDSLQQEKSFMKELALRKEAYYSRYKELMEQRNQTKFVKSKGQLELKKFLQQIQNLQKDLQSSVNNSKNDQCAQTQNIIGKLKNLEYFGKRKVNYITQNEISTTKKQSSISKNNTNRQSTKSKAKNDSVSLANENTHNPLTQVLTELKKNGYGFNRSKKAKKTIRCTTEESTNNENITILQSNKVGNKTARNFTKENLKINHNKFKEQFAKYRKDDLIYNNKITIRQQSQRLTTEESPLKLLKKQTKRYYQVRTQASHQTQRIPNTIQSKLFNQVDNNIESLGFSYENSKQIEKQKQTVYKKLTSEQKLMNKIKNEKKLFMTRKQRLHMQNQDLIHTYNSLTYDNKYFKNIVQAYEQTLDDQDKHYIFNNPIHAKQFSKNFISIANERAWMKSSQKTSRQTLNQTLGVKMTEVRSEEQEKLRTPFEKYLKNKENKIRDLKNKVNEGEFNETAGQAGFKPSLNQLTKPKTTDMKRVKTVPCMEVKLEK